MSLEILYEDLNQVLPKTKRISVEYTEGFSVVSVFGRAGSIKPQSGDYRADQITNSPKGSVKSKTVQGAIDELEAAATPKWQKACQTKAQFEAKREENKRLYPANGFLHWGNAPTEGTFIKAINQGLYTSTNESNSLFIGINSNESGDSQTNFARTIIAGVISDIYGISRASTSSYNTAIVFPPAPDGTVTYDSATGEITQHDSAAEAFAGSVGIDYAKTFTSLLNCTASETSLTFSGSAGVRQAAHTIQWRNDGNEEYILEFDMVATSGSIGVNVYGVGSNDGSVYSASTTAHHKVKFKPSDLSADFGQDNKLIFYTGSGNFVGTISNIQLHPATEEIVTRRIDMFGCEYFLREVTKADEWVYPNGCIQSQSADMNGVATVSNGIRPKSYFDQYQGQNGSSGKGVRFWTSATDEQRLTIVSDPANNLYWHNGKLYQWCLRVRTFAGAGNGDWSNVEANNPAWLQFSSFNNIRPQGVRDEVEPSGKSYTLFAGNHNFNPHYSQGVFAAIQGSNSPDMGAAANGHCYFQTWGTCSRLNTGAYHPEFNEFGTAGVRWVRGGGHGYWYDEDAHKITSASQCFNRGREIGCIADDRGDIASGKSYAMRPDGRYYDAIYSSGLGGINDLRMPCYDTGKPEYAAKVWEDVKSGVYRGAEKLKFTVIDNGISSATVSNSNAYTFSDESLVSVGAKISVVRNGVILINKATITQISGGNAFWDKSEGSYNKANGNVYYAVIEHGADITVSGEFTMQNVIGDPANILKVFPNGFYGEWILVIPDGVRKEYKYTRPNTEWISGKGTVNNGYSWNNLADTDINPIKNSRNYPIKAGEVWLESYKTKARQTEPTTRQCVEHIYPVFVSKAYNNALGRLLGFSLTGKINTDKQANVYSETIPLIRYSIDERDRKFYTDATYRPLPTHSDITLGATENNSSAFKVLPTLFTENKQANLQLNYSELHYLANSFAPWGDDGKIHIISNDGVENDLNGVPVRRGTHKLVKPFGYTH